MSVVDDLPQSLQPQGLFRGRISKNAASITAKIYITIEGFDPTLEFGPCRWPKNGVLLPERGDECLATQDDQREWWVVVWWPL